MFSTSVLFTPNGGGLFFHYNWMLLHCVFVPHFIFLSVDGYLDRRIHILSIMNSVRINMQKQLSLRHTDERLSFIFLFAYLFYFQTIFHSLLSSQFLLPHLLFDPPGSHPLLHLYSEKGRPHGYQQNIAYQVVVKLSTSPCIKAGQGNPVWGLETQKPTKESEIASVPQKDQAK